MVRTGVLFLVLACGLAFGVSAAGSVSITDQNATWGGISGCLKIVSTGATYYFSKAGGGFSGIVDKDGKDWIGHSTAAGAGGQYRGLPNTNEIGWRPEQTGSTTTITSQSSEKVTIAVTKNGTACTWDFYPDHATMTITQLKSGLHYNFSYEGCPGGAWNASAGYCTRGDDRVRHSLSVSMGNSDIRASSGETCEWIFYGVSSMKRAFYLVHHQDDQVSDHYRPMDPMTVFGFGRTDDAASLSSVPQTFSIGFCEDSAFAAVNQAVLTAVAGGTAVEKPGAAPRPAIKSSIGKAEIVTADGKRISPLLKGKSGLTPRIYMRSDIVKGNVDKQVIAH